MSALLRISTRSERIGANFDGKKGSQKVQAALVSEDPGAKNSRLAVNRPAARWSHMRAVHLSMPKRSKSGDVRLPLESCPSVDPRFAGFRLRVGRSRIERYGVFACEPIPRGRKVIEYTGKRRSRRPPRLGSRSRLSPRALERTYLISVNQRWVLDGAAGGSGAE